MKKGEEISLAFDGKIYRGVIFEMEKKRILFDLFEEIESYAYPKIALYQALAKGQKLETVLQHGTELGISSFGLVKTDHADLSSVEKKKGRYLRIIKDAAKPESSRSACFQR